MMTREGGAQPKEYLAKYAADRVRTVAHGVARLHVRLLPSATTTSSIRSATADFYSLAAFFADVKQWGVYSDYSYTPSPTSPASTTTIRSRRRSTSTASR